MADIKLRDRPPMQSEESVYSGMPVTDLSIIDMADGVNWLNFYNRPHVPAVRFLCDGEATGYQGGVPEIDDYSFVFPSTLPNADDKKLVVLLGMFMNTESAVIGKPRARTSANTMWTEADFAYSNPDTVGTGHGLQGAAYTDDGVIYTTVTLDLSNGNRNDLVQVDTFPVDGNLVYLSAWEMPNSVADYSSAGGLSRNKAKVDSSYAEVVNTYDIYAGQPIDNSLVNGIFTKCDNAWGYNGQVLVHVISQEGFLDGWTSSVGTPNAYFPYHGIYIPPTPRRRLKESSGDYYTTCRWAIYGYGDVGSCDVWVESEELSASSPTMAISSGTTPYWYPWQDDSVTSWTPSTAAGTCNVASDGDYIKIYAEPGGSGSQPRFFRFMLWVDND